MKYQVARVWFSLRVVLARSFVLWFAVRSQREDRSARSSRRLLPSTQRVIHCVAPRALESTRINSLGKWSPRRTRRAGRRNTVKRVDATIRRYLFLLLPPINSRSCVDDLRALSSICHRPASKSRTVVSVSSSPFYPRSFAYVFKILHRYAIRTYLKDRFTSVRFTTFVSIFGVKYLLFTLVFVFSQSVCMFIIHS